MKRTTKHVGLDVHQATTVISVREDTGRVIARGVVPTEEAALREFVRGMRGSVHVALEEGTQAQWLHDLLAPEVDRVVVCNRRGEAPRGHKADVSDADELSDLLRCDRLRPVYHGRPDRRTLAELARAYENLVEDGTRVRGRLKALFRARGIKTPGQQLYQAARRAEWLARLAEPGARFRAETLFAQLATVQELRPKAKRAMVAEAARDPSWPVLLRVPFLGPVRVAQLLAAAKTPWRFRTKRQLWAYAGLAVVTRATAEYELRGARPARRRRAPLTRGLNPNHNRVLKNVFKGAATAAAARDPELRAWYEARLARGMREAMARLTLARKLAALTLHLWKTGEPYDPTKLTLRKLTQRTVRAR
jgi:transposase